MEVRADALACNAHLRICGESRPFEFNDSVAAVARIADEVADVELGALACLAGVCCDLYILRDLRTGAVAEDGSAYWARGRVRAVPPELRRHTESHRTRRLKAAGSESHLFAGYRGGRRRRHSLANLLAELDAPASLWGLEGTEVLGRAPQYGGRRLLDPLNPWELWRAPEPADTRVASADTHVATHDIVGVVRQRGLRMSPAERVRKPGDKRYPYLAAS